MSLSKHYYHLRAAGRAMYPHNQDPPLPHEEKSCKRTATTGSFSSKATDGPTSLPQDPSLNHKQFNIVQFVLCISDTDKKVEFMENLQRARKMTEFDFIKIISYLKKNYNFRSDKLNRADVEKSAMPNQFSQGRNVIPTRMGLSDESDSTSNDRFHNLKEEVKPKSKRIRNRSQKPFTGRKEDSLLGATGDPPLLNFEPHIVDTENEQFIKQHLRRLDKNLPDSRVRSICLGEVLSGLSRNDMEEVISKYLPTVFPNERLSFLRFFFRKGYISLSKYVTLIDFVLKMDFEKGLANVPWQGYMYTPGRTTERGHEAPIPRYSPLPALHPEHLIVPIPEIREKNNSATINNERP